MGRRVRHLPFSLGSGTGGAKLSLYSASIRGLANGDPVSAWNDLTPNANNATGSGASRPTYNLSDTLFGGMPSITHAGSHYLNLASSINAASPWTVISAIYRSSGSAEMWDIGSTSGNNPYPFLLYTNGSCYGSNTAGFFTKSATPTGTVITTSQATSTITAWINGVGQSATYTAFASSGGFNIIGKRSTNIFATGRRALHVVYSATISNSLRARIQQSAGFAFHVPTK